MYHLQGDTYVGWSRVRFRTFGASCWYDNIYVTDGTGSQNTSFLGPTIVQMVLPTSQGVTNNWDASDASTTDHHLLVDDVASDGDTTYLEGDTSGEEQTFGFEDLVVPPGVVTGVIVTSTLSASGAGSDVSITVNDGSTGLDFSVGNVTDTSYLHYTAILENNPINGLAWDEATFNAMQFGVKID